MLGILTFLDPPRPDTKHTIEQAAILGVEVGARHPSRAAHARAPTLGACTRMHAQRMRAHAFARIPPWLHRTSGLACV